MSRKAFTLVELLVVIAIIALLMAILMPSLQRVKKQAQEVTCRSNLRQVGIAMNTYLHDNDFKMPNCYTHTNRSNRYFWYQTGSGVRVKTPMKPSDDESYWGTAYWDIVKNTNVFSCPSFINSAIGVGLDKLYGAPIKEFKDSAFALNGWTSELSTTSVRMQGEMIIVQEHIEPRIENGRRDMFFEYSGEGPLSHYDPGAGRALWYRAIFRHGVTRSSDHKTGGRCNVLYLDQHVASLTEREIMEEKKGKPKWYDPLEKWTDDWDG